VHYDHGTGLAAADVDGDGRPDLYFVTQLGRNELWKNVGDGRFADITDQAGVAMPDDVSVAAAFADIDNDGDPDLFVTTVRHGNRLFENMGGGRFRDITAQAGVGYVGHSSGAVFFDYDGDGLLDLFVTNVGVYTSNVKGPGGYYVGLSDAFHGHTRTERAETSILYHNLGGNRFKDVTRDVGLVDRSWSGDATVIDVNDDGWPDLYVLDMQGENHLWVNEGGKRFRDATRQYFPRTPWGAMGVKAFDFDGDGRVDDLNADGWDDIVITAGMNFPHRYGINSVLLNEAGRHFLPSEFLLGVEPRPGGATDQVWFRLDCHGADRDELFCTVCSQSGTAELGCRLDADGHLTMMAARGTRAAAVLDVDDDGDLDIVTNEFNAQPQVLVSDLAQRHRIHFLKVRLRGTRSNREGLGAQVTVVLPDGRRSLKVMDGKTGYLSQSDLPLYFG